MFDLRNDDDAMRCDFCQRVLAAVAKMVAGREAAICDDCVRDVVAVLARGATPEPYQRKVPFLPTSMPESRPTY